MPEMRPQDTLLNRDPRERVSWLVAPTNFRRIAGSVLCRFALGARDSGEIAIMRKRGLVVAGVVVALFGLLFTLQGVGVLKGSTMSNTTLWSVAGPVIIIVGLVVAGIGMRRRVR
jgi:hypothetical protein